MPRKEAQAQAIHRTFGSVTHHNAQDLAEVAPSEVGITERMASRILLLSVLSIDGASSLSATAPLSPLVMRPPTCVLARAPVLVAQAPVGDEDEDMSDAALMASFKARLDAEGGETRFRLKTGAQGAVESAKEAVDSVKESTSKLLDLGKNRPPADGLLDDNSWKATVGFFAFLIVISVANALFNAPPTDPAFDPASYGGAGLSGGVDRFTSDGGDLAFGRR